MPTITLPHGTVHYRTAGPADAAGPPALFVHGFLVDSQLWGGVADAAATAGVRSFAPDLPLGSHRHPLAEDAEQTPRGVARQIIAFMEALDLTDVTLVGNDTGGAVCQFLLDTDASRIGRLVLTNCDAFEQFPPASLDKFIAMASHPSALAAAAQAMRSTRVRHSRGGYGPFATSLDPAMTLSWSEPAREDAAVRRDAARFARAIDAADLAAVGSSPAPLRQAGAPRVGHRRSVLPARPRPTTRRRLPERRDRRGRGRPHVRPARRSRPRRRRDRRRHAGGVAPRCWVIRMYISGRR